MKEQSLVSQRLYGADASELHRSGGDQTTASVLLARPLLAVYAFRIMETS